jgi:hypothetical protein
MKLYIYKTNTTIQPFQDDVSLAQVLTETLAETQARAAQKNKLEIVRIDKPSEASERPCLLAADWTYFSEKALTDFIKTSNKKGAALALKRGNAVEHTLPNQDIIKKDWSQNNGYVVYDLWLIPDGSLPDDPKEVRQHWPKDVPPYLSR